MTNHSIKCPFIVGFSKGHGGREGEGGEGKGRERVNQLPTPKGGNLEFMETVWDYYVPSV